LESDEAEEKNGEGGGKNKTQQITKKPLFKKEGKRGARERKKLMFSLTSEYVEQQRKGGEKEGKRGDRKKCPDSRSKRDGTHSL